MNPLTRLTLNIRRRETPFYDRLYRIAKVCRSVSLPAIPGLHRFLYAEWATRTSMWHSFWRVVYYEPMFKSRCRAVGRNFRMTYAGNGTCRILGNLHLYLGDNVTFFDNVGLVGLKLLDAPELVVGSNTYIGPRTRFMVAGRITVGSHTILGSDVMAMDNPGHPVDAYERMAPGGGSPPMDSIRPVSVGDFCQINTRSFLYPGTTVSDGVIARVDTHLVGDIPPFSVVAGNPGSVRRLLAIPPKLRDVVGEQRYRGWLEAQEAYAARHPEIKQEKQPC